jgi:hypothetical protein
MERHFVNRFFSIAFLVIIILVVACGIAAYLFFTNYFQTKENISNNSSTTSVQPSTASTISNVTTASNTYSISSGSITWKEGQLTYVITGASTTPFTGIADCVMGHFPCAAPNIIAIHLGITNNGSNSYPTSDIVFNVKLVNSTSTTRGFMSSTQIIFAHNISVLKANQTTNVEMDFQSYNQHSNAFMTGDSSNDFFVVPYLGGVEQTNCIFPTTSTFCMKEIQ